MAAVERITVSRELSFSPLFRTTRRFGAGKTVSLRQFEAGGYGTLYRCENEGDVPLVVKLLHEGGDCRAIAGLHSIIAKHSNHFTPGWHALLRGLPFWVGDVTYQGKPRIALVSLDLEPLGFLQLKVVLQRQWREYFALDLLKRVRIAASFARAASILEELKFLHADINAENLFVNLQTCEALLIDFDTGVLRITGNELPQTPGKPNEFLASELKNAVGAQLSKFNEEAERWAVGVMVHTLIFGVQPLFFLPELSVNAIEQYLGYHRWPMLGLRSGFAHLVTNPKTMRREADFYLHFRYREFGLLEKLRPEAHAAFRTFINEGAIKPQFRPLASEWAQVLAEPGEKIVKQELPVRSCSFCENARSPVYKLVRHSAARICDECKGRLGVGDPVDGKEELIYHCPDFSTWETGVSDDGLARTSLHNGFYHVAMQKAARKRGGEAKLCLIYQPSITPVDFRATVQAAFDPEFLARSSEDAFYGLFFRHTRAPRYRSYYLFLVTRRGEFRLSYHVDPRYITGTEVHGVVYDLVKKDIILINWSRNKCILKDGGLNTLEVEMVGDTLILGINGETMASLTDERSECASGEAGICLGTLEVQPPEVWFRNLEIYKINSKRGGSLPPSADPPRQLSGVSIPPHW